MLRFISYEITESLFVTHCITVFIAIFIANFNKAIIWSMSHLIGCWNMKYATIENILCISQSINTIKVEWNLSKFVEKSKTSELCAKTWFSLKRQRFQLFMRFTLLILYQSQKICFCKESKLIIFKNIARI